VRVAIAEAQFVGWGGQRLIHRTGTRGTTTGLSGPCCARPRHGPEHGVGHERPVWRTPRSIVGASGAGRCDRNMPGPKSAARRVRGSPAFRVAVGASGANTAGINAFRICRQAGQLDAVRAPAAGPAVLPARQHPRAGLPRGLGILPFWAAGEALDRVSAALPHVSPPGTLGDGPITSAAVEVS
jgi:hypothetical protein